MVGLEGLGKNLARRLSYDAVREIVVLPGNRSSEPGRKESAPKGEKDWNENILENAALTDNIRAQASIFARCNYTTLHVFCE